MGIGVFLCLSSTPVSTTTALSVFSWLILHLFLRQIGGLQNKAPQLERMRGAVFAAPLPLAFHSLSTQSGETLKSLA